MIVNVTPPFFGGSEATLKSCLRIIILSIKLDIIIEVVMIIVIADID